MKLLKRLLVTYFIVLIICIAAFAVFIPRYVLNAMTEEIKANQEEKLAIFYTKIDGYMTELFSVANNISINWSLKPFTVQSSAYNEALVAQELRKYLGALNYVSEIGYYFRGDTHIYTSQGKVLRENFLNTEGNGNRFCFNRLTNEKFFSYLDECSGAVTLSSFELSDENGSQSYCMYILPINMATNSPYATLIYVLNVSSFEQAVSSILEEQSTISAIFDGQDLLTNVKG